jgi:hypothetical protein
VYIPFALLTVLAEAAVNVAIGTLFLGAGTVGLIGVGQSYFSQSASPRDPDGALFVSRSGATSVALLFVVVSLGCLVAGLMFWTK